MWLVAVVAAVWVLVVVAAGAAWVWGPRSGWVAAGGLGAAAVMVAVGWLNAGPVGVALPWIPALEVALRLRLDGLGALFAVLVLGVGAVVMAYSTAYVTERRPAGFVALMTGFAAAMLTLVLADDLVLLFVAWEITTLCSYLLILRVGPAGRAPAARTLLVTVAGGLALLGAVTTMIVRTGHTELSAVLADPAWTDDPGFAATVAVLVAVAAMTKAAQFPFHSWLPDAMVAPAPVSAYLHAAAMVKAGVYLVMRFAGAGSATPVWTWLLVAVGVTTALMGGVFALGRSDLKELLAYSTVSQLGLLFAVIGLGTTAALLAAAVHVVAHALFKSAGFMAVGLLERRTGTRDLQQLRGLGRAMPATAAMVALAAASMAGVPLLLGFVSKEYVLEAALGAALGAAGGEAGAVGAAGVVVLVGLSLASVLTVAYSARLVWPVLAGPARAVRPVAGTRAMGAAVAVVAVAGLALGPAVAVLEALVVPAGGAATGTAPYAGGVSPWHGFGPALALSALILTAGVLLAWRWRRVDGLLRGRRLFPVDGIDVVERARAAVIDLGHRVGAPTRRDAPSRHLVPPAVVLAVLGFAAVVSAAATALAGGSGLAEWSWWRPAAGTTQIGDLFLLALVAVGVVALLRARTRLVAVLAAGVAGFGVTLWFYALGAADVALTQLLVEVLTVVVLVLVLPRLPERFAHAARAARARGAGRVPRVALAAVLGAVATLGALALTGHRGLSGAGEWFVRNAEAATGGTNVVNTILVDFRALDTLGELAVLALAAFTLAALLDARGLLPRRTATQEQARASFAGAVADPVTNAVFLGVLARVLVPLQVLVSLWLLVRGHTAPGGGFIGALVGAAALMLGFLAAPSDDSGRSRMPFLTVAGLGVAVAVGVGLIGLVDGSFLRPLHGEVLGISLTTALLFDVGVYLAVLGVLAAATSLLSRSPDPATPRARPLDPDADHGPDPGPALPGRSRPRPATANGAGGSTAHAAPTAPAAPSGDAHDAKETRR